MGGDHVPDLSSCDANSNGVFRFIGDSADVVGIDNVRFFRLSLGAEETHVECRKSKQPKIEFISPKKPRAADSEIGS
jgi:hypothetical protein